MEIDGSRLLYLESCAVLVNSLKKEIKEANKDVGCYIEDMDILKQENEQLNQRIKNLVSENTNLQNELYTDQLQTEELEYHLVKLNKELYDAHVMKTRLLKILNETSDYT